MIEETIKEWESKNRRMGCVAAARFFCYRTPGFWPKRLIRYTKDGELYEHVVASNGKIIVDLAPYADRSRDD